MQSDSLDANLLVHFILDDVPGQRTLVTELLQTPNTIHYLNEIAISETIYVLERIYKQPRSRIINEVNMFLTHYCDEIIYNRSLTMIAFPLYLEHHDLSFNDCLLSAHAKIDHAEPLYTFDQALAKKSPSAKLLN